MICSAEEPNKFWIKNVNAFGTKPKEMTMSRKEEREQAACDKLSYWEDGRITVKVLNQ